jgi:hypothetical protein
MTPEEQDAVEAITSLPTFESNPAGEVGRATQLAADAETGVGIHRGTVPPGWAAFWTHVACHLVAAAANPSVTRGTVLDGLVEKYGDGS